MAAGWIIEPARPRAVTTDLAGSWLDQHGVLTIYPSTAEGQVRSIGFEAPGEGRDSATVRDLFLGLVDTLTARFGPPTGWGLGGLYTKDGCFHSASWRPSGGRPAALGTT